MSSLPEEVRLDDVMPQIRELLAMGQSVRLYPKGVSMMPMLRQGIDSVLLSPVQGKLKKYDLPLYQLMLWRLLNYFLIGMVEWLILFAVLRSRAVMTQLGSLTKERENK